MAALRFLVDFDNVERGISRAGPASLARILVSRVPSQVLAKHEHSVVRLYGGWREKGQATRAAQDLIPKISRESPLYIGVMHSGVSLKVRVNIEMADRPIGASSQLPATMVRDRSLRSFRALPQPWLNCTDEATCGLSSMSNIRHTTSCSKKGCRNTISDILVRDEQKMVDTLIVADLAHNVFSERATHVVVVSSDSDMWPGILLALRAGCQVLHFPGVRGQRTDPGLRGTLDVHMQKRYIEMSL